MKKLNANYSVDVTEVHKITQTQYMFLVQRTKYKIYYNSQGYTVEKLIRYIP